MIQQFSGRSRGIWRERSANVPVHVCADRVDRRIALLTAAVIVIGVFGIARADAASDPPKSECLDRLAKIELRHSGIKDHMNGIELRDLKTLRGAARTFARREKNEACESVVDGIAEILSARREAFVDQGLMLDVDEAAHRRRLKSARAVTALERPLRASDVIGTELQNLDAVVLGEVDDVVMESDGINISHLLVSRGGFLGIGEEWIVVPLDALSATDNFAILVLPMSEERLSAAPKIESDDMRELRDADWRRENDTFFSGAKAG